MRLPYVLRRLLYALRYAVIGFRTGWRAHKQIHDLAQYYGGNLSMRYLHNAMAGRTIGDPPWSEMLEEREVHAWLNDDS